MNRKSKPSVWITLIGLFAVLAMPLGLVAQTAPKHHIMCNSGARNRNIMAEPFACENVSFTGFNSDLARITLPHDLAQLILESDGKPINYVFESQK